MAGKKVISLVFGSESDLEHVKKVTVALRQNEWVRSDTNGIYQPTDASERIYAVFPGSVHRDLDGTVEYARDMSMRVDGYRDKLVFLTCIGINDDASGTISSNTGKRVFAIPPDKKGYNKYPGGVRVYPFNSHEDRTIDITAGVEAIRIHFCENHDWDKEDLEAANKRSEARGKLEKLRQKLFSGEIEL